MADGTPSPSSTDNAGLIAQAQSSSGAGATTTINTPLYDVSQLQNVLEQEMYASGGTATGGMAAGRQGLHGTAGTTQITTTVRTQTVADWINAYYTQIINNPQLRQQFSTEAQLAGMVGANANSAQLFSAWQKLVMESYNNYAIGGQNVTPWDVLANSIPGSQAGSYKNNSGYQAMTSMTAQQAADLATKAAQKDASKTTQASQIDINYTDPDTARYVLNQASQQLLGRQATNDEIAKFTKALNANEAMFPKMTQDTRSTQTGTTTTTTPGMGISELGGQGQTIVSYDAAGNPIYGPTGTTTSSNTTGNTTDTVVSLGEQDYTRYGREQLAQDFAKQSPDYGAYQAAGPLFQAFLGVLKGAVSGVGSNA